MSHFNAADWAAILAHEDTALEGPASEQGLADFERAIEVPLPASHKEFLRRGNGGVVGFVRMFGIDRSDTFDLRHQIEVSRPLFLETAEGRVLPFASDWGKDKGVISQER